MPDGAIPGGYAIPYTNIRIDDFSACEGDATHLYMLTHTHSDHIQGLANKSFASPLVCSKDAKQMLLNHEPLKERLFRDGALKGDYRRPKTFSHLKRNPATVAGKVYWAGTRDLMVSRAYCHRLDPLDAIHSALLKSTGPPTLYSPTTRR